MFEEDFWENDEDSEEDACEKVEVEEPLNEGEEGHQTSPKVAFHIPQTPVPQLHLFYHFTQPTLCLWTTG